MKEQNTHNNQRNTHAVAVSGLVCALSVAFFDIIINIFDVPIRYDSFLYVLGPLAVTVVAGIICYLVVWFSVASVLVRVFNLEQIPLAVSLAVLQGTLLILTSMVKVSDIPYNYFILSTYVAISIAVSVGAYFTVATLGNRPRVTSVLRILALALPVIFAETMILAWARAYRLVASGPVISRVVIMVYASVVLVTIGIFFRFRRRAVREWVLVAITFGVVFAPAAGAVFNRPERNEIPFQSKETRIKKIVLITVDTLRRDALSCYNPQAASSPNTDRLAEDGILFTRAISPSPWTLPSVASIMTGLAANVHLVFYMDSKLPKGPPTLAEHMRKAGYLTAAIGNNYLLSPQQGFDRGFDEYDWYRKPSLGYSYGEWILKRMFPDRFKIDATANELTESAVAWLTANAKNDYFLWIHYLAPHEPYAPPEEYLPNIKQPSGMSTNFEFRKMRTAFDEARLAAQRRWIRGLYDGEVQYVDDGIGRVLDTLEELGLYDETLIVFTSDHGEEFWEHNGYSHGQTLYNELIEVPLIVKPPFSSSSRVVKTTVTTQSIMPTVLELCGIDFTNDYLKGNSLAPLLEQEQESFVEQPVFSTGTGQRLREELESVVFDGFKYIRSRMTGREELYDLDDDNGENQSVVALLPEQVEIGRRLLDQHNERADELRIQLGIQRERVNETKERLQRLRALGYI